MGEERMSKNYKYDAFISYRHTELDKFVAEKIHKYLEDFKLPKNVKDKNGITKTKIERVFRDKEELTITNNLEDPIIQALMGSEYLIVICSPRLKESIWCRKEIESFIKFHGRNKILTVLIEGEPDESFPEELLFEDEVVNINGIETIHRKAVEPLAADIRAGSKSQMCKLLKSELLRVIAPMFGLEYDDLRQRHRERRMKRILTATISAATLGIAIGVAGITSALVINNQKEQIKEQNEKLLYNQADNLADEAIQYFEQDRRVEALKSAYASVTEYEGIEMPYTPNGEYSLTQALRIYDAGGVFKANKQFASSANIMEMKLSPSKKYVMSFDNSMQLYLWDVITGSLMMQIEDIQSTNLLEIPFEFVGDSKIVYLTNSGKVKVVDFTNQQEVFVIDDNEYVLSVKSDSEGKYVAIVYSDKIDIYDASTGESMYQIETNEGKSLDTKVFWNDDKLFYLEEDQSENTIKSIDINSKNTYEIKGDFTRIADVKGTDDYAYVLVERFDGMDGENFAAIIAVDKNGNVKWENRYADIPLSEISIIEGEGEKLVITTSYSEIFGFDGETGEVKCQESISEGIADILVGTEEVINILTMEGRIIGYYAFSGEMYGMDYLMECNVSELNQFEICQEGLLLLPTSSNYIIKYEVINNEDKKKYEGDVDELIIKSTPVEEETIDIDNSELIDSFVYTEDKKVAFITYLDMSMDIYDVVNKKVINSVKQVDYAPSCVFGTDKDGKIYIGSVAGGYCFDKDYNMLWEIENLLYVDIEKNSLLISDVEGECWEFPIYTFDELIKKAEEEIK